MAGAIRLNGSKQRYRNSVATALAVGRVMCGKPGWDTQVKAVEAFALTTVAGVKKLSFDESVEALMFSPQASAIFTSSSYIAESIRAAIAASVADVVTSPQRQFPWALCAAVAITDELKEKFMALPEFQALPYE